jgi:xanthine phosphoribosyltransferase
MRTHAIVRYTIGIKTQMDRFHLDMIDTIDLGNLSIWVFLFLYKRGTLRMKELKDRILQDGKVLSERVIKVDSFLNHQVDPALTIEIGKVMADRFRDQKITKVLTIEASGIHIAFATALSLAVPFVYAKKKKAITQSGDTYVASVFSFTRQETTQITLSKQFLTAEDRVLIVDDILAEGAALTGLIEIVKEAGAQLVGVSIAIEKSFQQGRKKLDEAGIEVYSLARIGNMSPEDGIEFLSELSTYREGILC